MRGGLSSSCVSSSRKINSTAQACQRHFKATARGIGVRQQGEPATRQRRGGRGEGRETRKATAGGGTPRPRRGSEPRGKIDKTTRHRGGRGPGDSAGDPTRKTTPRGTQAGREGGKARHEGTKSSSPDGAEDELSIAQLELSAEFLPQAASGRRGRLTILILVSLGVNRPAQPHEGGSLVRRAPPSLKGQRDKSSAGLSIPPPLSCGPVASSQPVPPSTSVKHRRVSGKRRIW